MANKKERLDLNWTALSGADAAALDTPYRPLMDKMELVRKSGKRLLVLNKDRYLPISIAVVTLDEIHERFALGHTTDKLTGERQNYCINYADMLDAKSGLKIAIEK